MPSAGLNDVVDIDPAQQFACSFSLVGYAPGKDVGLRMVHSREPLDFLYSLLKQGIFVDRRFPWLFLIPDLLIFVSARCSRSAIHSFPSLCRHLLALLFRVLRNGADVSNVAELPFSARRCGIGGDLIHLESSVHFFNVKCGVSTLCSLRLTRVLL
jgi:hypothetical protein